MRRILFILAVALAMVAPTFAQTTTITATHLVQDNIGTLIPSGKLCAVAVSQTTGQPTSFEVSGNQVIPIGMTCFTITNGAISGASLYDTSLTSPVIGYKLSITDSTGKTLFTYPQPIYPFSTTWSLDTWTITESAVIANPTTVSRGNNAPQGRCGNAPAIYYTETNVYTCWDQIWLTVTSGGVSVTGSAINSALGFTPISNSALAAAIAAIPAVTASDISTALSYTPLSATDLTTAIAAIPPPTNSQVTTALGYTPVNPSALSSYVPFTGGTLTGPLVLAADPTTSTQAATRNYVDTQITAALGSGGGSSGSIGNPGTNIGTVVRTGVLTDGNVAFKTCYVGGSVCSGGVGSIAPSSTPQRVPGLNTPSASTGTANAVASHSVSTSHAAPSFTDVLWTTTGGGLGADTTSTNWYRDFWMKAAFPAGHTHFEFDTYNFDGSWDWMWGTQCNATKNIIQYDNQTNGWVDTSIPCSNLFDGNYHHIQQTFHRDLAAAHNCAGNTAPCQWWDDIVIDGTTYVIGKSLPATTTTWTGSGGQIQLDTEPTTASGGSPATATVYIDTDTVTAGLAANAGTTNPGGNGGTTTGTGELDSFNFDSGTPTSVGLTTVGSPTVGTPNAHSAPNAAAFSAGNNYFIDTLSAPTMTIYSRQYVEITSIGSTSNAFLRYYTSGGAEMFSFFFNASNGFPSVFNQASGATTTMQSSAYPTGSMHYIETFVRVSATAGQIICKIDGTTVYTSASTLNTGTTNISNVWFGEIGNTAPVGWGTTWQDNADWSAVGWIGSI